MNKLLSKLWLWWQYAPWSQSSMVSPMLSLRWRDKVDCGRTRTRPSPLVCLWNFHNKPAIWMSSSHAHIRQWWLTSNIVSGKNANRYFPVIEHVDVLLSQWGVCHCWDIHYTSTWLNDLTFQGVSQIFCTQLHFCPYILSILFRESMNGVFFCFSSWSDAKICFSSRSLCRLLGKPVTQRGTTESIFVKGSWSGVSIIRFLGSTSISGICLSFVFKCSIRAICWK